MKLHEMKSLFILIGTRPNFIKITRFKELALTYNFDVKIIHSGQHFDQNMASVFFEQFKLTPDYFLNVGGLSPNSQIAHIMLKLEELFTEIGKPDFLMVPGDVNSTLAGSIAANKLGVKLIHLESGLRSFDKKMPEEHNRVLSDNLSDICFVTEESGIRNLKNEGVNSSVYFVGNTMIDTLVKFDSNIESSTILSEIGLERSNYMVGTFHRPSNVDSKEALVNLIDLLNRISSKLTVVLPLHPRTRKMIQEFNLNEKLDSTNLVITDPLGYFEFQKLIKYCSFVLTDSGGIQEETTFRQIPCLTLRENTERPITVTHGSNELIKFDSNLIMTRIEDILSGKFKKGSIPELWDGRTTERIFEILKIKV